MTIECVIEGEVCWDETPPRYGFGVGYRRHDIGPNCAGLWVWLDWGVTTRQWTIWHGPARRQPEHW